MVVSAITENGSARAPEAVPGDTVFAPLGSRTLEAVPSGNQALDPLGAWREQVRVPEPVNAPVIWEAMADMSPEKARRVAGVLSAVVNKYKGFAVKPEDFSVVDDVTQTTPEGTMVITALALTGTRSIRFGDGSVMYDKKRNWESIDPANSKANFTVSFDGHDYDERSGSVLEVMQAVAARNPAIRGESLWETGRSDLVDNSENIPKAPQLYMANGRASRHMVRADDGHRITRYRPALVVDRKKVV